MSHIGRQTKEIMVQTLTQRLQTTPNLLITSFEKLTVANANELRRSLHHVSSHYVVAKGTLAQRALASLGWDGAAQLLHGSVGFILAGEDAAKASKVLLDFIKAHEGALVVRGAWMDGAVLSTAQVTELAKLPSRQELLAQLVMTIEGPLADLVNTLEGVLRETVFVLDEVAKGRAAATSAGAQPPTTEQAQGGST